MSQTHATSTCQVIIYANYVTARRARNWHGSLPGSSGAEVVALQQPVEVEVGVVQPRNHRSPKERSAFGIVELVRDSVQAD